MQKKKKKMFLLLCPPPFLLGDCGRPWEGPSYIMAGWAPSHPREARIHEPPRKGTEGAGARPDRSLWEAAPPHPIEINP